MNERLFGEQEKLRLLLRQIRLDAEMTQVDLANSLSQPQSFISKYESGQRRVDLVELKNICEHVGITLAEFVRRFEAENES